MIMQPAKYNIGGVFALCLILASCAPERICIDAGLGMPPDELIALLDKPKRLVRTFSQGQSVDTNEADEAAREIIRLWNIMSHSSTAWPSVAYFQMKGIRYVYKEYYVYQIYSPIRILPIAILIPMDEGIVVIVNQPKPFRKHEYFPVTPWDFDDRDAN